MKKVVLILFVFAASTLSTLASVEKELGGVNIYLSCRDTPERPSGKPAGRAPMKMPEISISESSVEIEEKLLGYTMTLPL